MRKLNLFDPSINMEHERLIGRDLSLPGPALSSKSWRREGVFQREPWQDDETKNHV